MRQVLTLQLHGNLVKNLKRPQQKLDQLLVVDIHQAWVEPWDDQEHLPHELVLLCPSVQINIVSSEENTHLGYT